MKKTIFDAPFKIEYSTYYKLRFGKLKQIEIELLNFENNLISVILDKNSINKTNMAPNHIVNYGFEIAEGNLIEYISSEEGTIKYYSKVNEEVSDFFIKEMLALYGIVEYGWLNTDLSRDTLKIELIQDLKKDENYVFEYSGEVYKKNYTEGKIHIKIQEYGFYYIPIFAGDYSVREHNMNVVIERESKRDFENEIKKLIEKTYKRNKVKYLFKKRNEI